MKRLLIAALLLCSGSVYAQNTIVAATNFVDGGGNKIQTGRITMLPTDINGNPVNASLGASIGVMLPRAEVCLLVNGAITTTPTGGTCTVLDTSLTNSAHFCYRTTIIDTVTQWTAPVMPCVQPTGSTWTFDTYVPPAAPTAQVVAGPAGVAGPACSTGTGTCTMTVPIVLPANPTTALQATTKQYVDPAFAGSANDATARATASAALPANGVTTTPGGNLQASTVAAVTSNSTATNAQTATVNFLSPTYTPLKISGTYWTGDSVLCSGGAVAQGGGFAYLFSYAVAGNNNFANWCAGGSQAADATYTQFFVNPPNTSLGSNVLMVEEAGINDAYYCGATTGCENNFLYSTQTRLTFPATLNRQIGQNCTKVSGTWTNDTGNTSAYGVTSTVNGSHLQCSLTTYAYTQPGATTATNGSICYGWKAFDGNGGQATVFLNGSQIDAINAYGFNGQTIATHNGNAQTVFTKCYQTAPGTQTVDFYVSSATGAGNAVPIEGIWSAQNPAWPSQFAPPLQVTTGVLRQQNDASSSTTAAYDTLKSGLASTLSSYGFPVLFYNVRNYVDAVYDMSSSTVTKPAPLLTSCVASSNPGLHPNNCGHLDYFNGLMALLQPMTGGSVGPRLDLVPKIITTSATIGQGDQLEVCNDSTITLTLPSYTSIGPSYGGVWVKNFGAGPCIIAPPTGLNLDGVTNGTETLLQQNAAYIVYIGGGNFETIAFSASGGGNNQSLGGNSSVTGTPSSTTLPSGTPLQVGEINGSATAASDAGQLVLSAGGRTSFSYRGSTIMGGYGSTYPVLWAIGGTTLGGIDSDGLHLPSLSLSPLPVCAYGVGAALTTAGCNGTVKGVATLISGTVTVSNSAACTPGAACAYKLVNCGKNASTGIGTLAIGTVSAGTNFAINSLGPTAAVLTTDVSSVCWQIN